MIWVYKHKNGYVITRRFACQIKSTYYKDNQLSWIGVIEDGTYKQIMFHKSILTEV